MADFSSLLDDDLKYIASCQKTKATVVLAERLGLVPYDKDFDMSTDIYVDFLYDHLMFAVEKGFPWKHACFVIKFADSLFKFSKGKLLTETVIWYRQEAVNLTLTLGETFFKTYTDFVFKTFMSHYQLFQYVLSQDREKLIPNVTVDVTPPTSPNHLKESKEKQIFEYQQKISIIEKLESERENELMPEKETLHEKAEEKIHVLFEEIKVNEETLTKENLSEMVKNIIQSYTSSLSQELKTSIIATQESLEYKLEKTSIPRPQVLGPPPRYKLKAPVSSRGKGRKTPEDKPKSAKRTSSKSK